MRRTKKKSTFADVFQRIRFISMRRIKILVISIIILSINVTTLKAQGFYTGIRAGLNVTGVTDRVNSDAKLGANFGVMGGYQFSTILALEVEVLYSFQGYYTGKNSPEAPFAPNNTQVNLDYIKIPVIAKLYLIKGFFIEGGVSFNFMTSALIEKEPRKGLNNFDFSIPVGLGYLFGRKFEVSARYDISTSPITPEFSGVNSVFSVNLGFRF